jgi:hypothetical protein
MASFQELLDEALTLNAHKAYLMEARRLMLSRRLTTISIIYPFGGTARQEFTEQELNHVIWLSTNPTTRVSNKVVLFKAPGEQYGSFGEFVRAECEKGA